jgi:hypothetical protein
MIQITSYQIVESNRSDWIVFPDEFLEGKYSNFCVSPGRVAYSPELDKVGKELGLNLNNTAKDSLDREFVGNINYEQRLKINFLMGNNTLDLKQFWDFYLLLDEGAKENIQVYDFSGKLLESDYLEKIRNDIFGVKSPWRGEGLNASFKFENNIYYLEKAIGLNKDKNLIYTREKLLEDFLKEDRTLGINLSNLLKTANNQGLPTIKTEAGNLFYFAPDKTNNSCAGLDAVEDRASCVLHVGLAGCLPRFGVRAYGAK